jgi:hypothetical protein
MQKNADDMNAALWPLPPVDVKCLFAARMAEALAMQARGRQ